MKQLRRALVAALPLLAALAVLPSRTSGQPVQNPFSSYAEFRDSLTVVTTIPDSGAREAALSDLWGSLSGADLIPFALGDSVAFLYRTTTASNVAFAGDFNSWNPQAGPASRLGASDVWLREEVFPSDARLDYKIVRNGNDWILDPINPHQQRGGFGFNSELRMPGYQPSPWVDRIQDIPEGTFTPARSLTSQVLGYSVRYQVYTPSGYEEGVLANLPVIYVTDGPEYSDDRMGSMRIVLDNLLAGGHIEPVIAVFIDPRVNGANLRATQYVENRLFADFVADELVPVIDQVYRTDARREARAILGTSLGGLNSAYFGAVRPETFRLIAIQSPAFWAGSSIYSLYSSVDTRDLKIHMTWGTIRDVADAGEQMADILSSKGYEHATLAVNEGHSWGNWRALLDDMLIYFWGTDTGTSRDQATAVVLPVSLKIDSVYPSPFRDSTLVEFTLGGPGQTRIEVFDLLGRQVQVAADGYRQSGLNRVAVDGTSLTPGVYVVRIQIDGSAHSRVIHRVR